MARSPGCFWEYPAAKTVAIRLHRAGSRGGGEEVPLPPAAIWSGVQPGHMPNTGGGPSEGGPENG